MANSKTNKSNRNERVRLDGRWLLGDEPKKKSSLWFRTVVVLFCAGVAVWTWPITSRLYLQYQFGKQLEAASTSEQAIPIISKLAQLLPGSAQELLIAFEKEDPQTAELAYRHLDTFLDQLLSADSSDHASLLQRFALSLDRSKAQFSEEGKYLSLALAQRMEAATRNRTDISSIQTARCSENIMAYVEKAPADPVQESIVTPVNPLRDDGTSGNQLVPSSQTIKLKDISVDEIESQSTNSDVETPKPIVSRLPINMLSQKNISVGDSTIHEVNSISKPEPTADSEFARLVDARDSNDSAIIGGMEKLDPGAVVKLLASVQQETAASAAMELLRRGMSETDLQLAQRMARGDTETRIECMQSIVGREGWNPIPWLTWMGEDGNREVRQHAINLLGSIASEESIRELKYLLKRERDDEIAEQIQQVMGSRLAASTVTSARGKNREGVTR